MNHAIRKTRLAARFLAMRLTGYVQLAQYELIDAKLDLIKALVGVGLLAGAGILFITFLSVALIVTVWDSEHRTSVAWVVCAVWGVLAAGGFWTAKSVVTSPLPFKHLTREIKDDIAAMRGEL